ncbi:GlxA family transcriptional regulator [Flavihumibacter cheonanensis]|uniref:GlxA family transcriptional regulator n=1 Tax=Flavihumibacter cheonanensis TaxID=1442385 RepID=UPI001EF7845E|nr:DJ-1/PfpI family protein [Flavihumibacter cheonanensis]MCG7751713.1 DJ-1/PfpI family protein [Flavihumibacter cheonanensis]
MKKIAFIIPPAVELLDLAGPMQVFSEASFYGFEVQLEFYSIQPDTASSVGLPFGKLQPYSKAALQAGDFIIIPGVRFESLKVLISWEKAFFHWLRDTTQRGINICSICNAAFFLGEAGLLNNRECTTHWRRVDALQKQYPKARVLNDVLFVKTDSIYTSAGISAGIDLALSILEELTDPLFVNKVARGLVVYYRRSHQHTQQNIYLDYRNHINPKVHQVQDYLVEQLASELSLEKLANLVNTSPRNLSRIFKEATGITIGDYLTKIRIEKAKTLKNNPDYTIEYIAAACGFKSPRQLQRILKSTD